MEDALSGTLPTAILYTRRKTQLGGERGKIWMKLQTTNAKDCWYPQEARKRQAKIPS